MAVDEDAGDRDEGASEGAEHGDTVEDVREKGPRATRWNLRSWRSRRRRRKEEDEGAVDDKDEEDEDEEEGKLSSMATMVPPMDADAGKEDGWAPEIAEHADTEAKDNRDQEFLKKSRRRWRR